MYILSLCDFLSILWLSGHFLPLVCHWFSLLPPSLCVCVCVSQRRLQWVTGWSPRQAPSVPAGSLRAPVFDPGRLQTSSWLTCFPAQPKPRRPRWPTKLLLAAARTLWHMIFNFLAFQINAVLSKYSREGGHFMYIIFSYKLNVVVLV